MYLIERYYLSSTIVLSSAIIALLLLAMPIIAVANEHGHEHEHQHEHEDEHEHENKSAEAHIHGRVDITMVLDAKTLQIQVASPAENLIGFEHQPQTPEQKQLITTALAQLKNVSKWIALNGGECSLVHAHVSTSLALDHEHGHQEKDQHHNFTSEYEYQCQQPKLLTGVSVSLQREFSRIENVELQWIIHGKQGKKTQLAPNKTFYF